MVDVGFPFDEKNVVFVRSGGQRELFHRFVVGEQPFAQNLLGLFRRRLPDDLSVGRIFFHHE